MIEGHGDDAYRYPGIRSDFSSNICTTTSHRTLMAHLAAHPDLLAHYPEPEAWSLERLIAEHYDIDPASVIVTNGATEAIYLIAQTFRLMRHIGIPTFQEYDDACQMFKVTDDDKKMLWFCNPNNPTGRVVDSMRQKRIVKEYDMVVIDQSYERYTRQGLMAPRTAIRHGNVVLIYSFTKTYCVPGLRLGYIVAQQNLAAAIRQYLRPWSVSALAIEAGKFLLQHDELICQPDFSEARRLHELLSRLPGVSVEPTHATFMLARIEGYTAADLKDYLAREHRMLIRDASNFRGLTPQHFRVASQTPAENDALVAAIKEYIEHRTQ